MSAMRAEKTRLELCDLLKTLSRQLYEMSVTVNDLQATLYNEEDDEEE